MIAQIQGKLLEKTPTEVVIDCNGVGYHINISLHTYTLLPKTDFIKLYTHLIIKEDAHSLYGFVEKSEKEIFKMLLTVSGIGAAIARTMLSSLEPKQIIQALASGDVNTIQSIKGIGGKTAQRAILDLKDKVLKLYDLDEVSMFQNNTNRDEALSALEVLGFVLKTSEKLVEKIIKEDPDASVESIIKKALKSNLEELKENLKLTTERCFYSSNAV
jgi:Holliday junction DNA helicase RuvA